ncbi:response regulator [Sulfurimonas aquatica]|uniref:Response regulator n=1 Tax=Sulfurimonas aquatica TaxID=2672570 RepID=A0A975GCP4_9BACT|nr:HD domain-containing phosphohydrolase [Sulfurimonas aquatica]QSZ41916.1 response regulator [Sulfurimonas aquatica]
MSNELKSEIAFLKEKAKTFSILYIEDEDGLREKFVTFLKKIFDHVDSASNGEEGLQLYLNNLHDIVITDIQMPKMDGLELIGKLREINDNQEIIILSAYTDASYLLDSIELGVTGYMIKPVDIIQALKVIKRSTLKLSAFRENAMYKSKLEEMVEERTEKILALQNQSIDNYQHMIHSMISMIDGRDTYTAGHSERVANYSKEIAKAMGFTKEQCALIYEAGILHDIGKLITPDAILLKPGKLTDQEYALIKEHVTSGYEILCEVPMYHELADIVYTHHEHYDGSGYPRAIKGEEIPMAGRIMAVSDAFDAMTTSRIYKSRKSVNEAVEELKHFSGSWYDPTVIKFAEDILKSVNIDSNINQDPCTHVDDERFAYFYKDSLTDAYNHYYLDFIFYKNKEDKNLICMNVIYLRNFTAYNKEHGWGKGDLLLKSFATYLRSEFPDSQVFRIFGDDFVLLKSEHKEIDIDKINSNELLVSNNLYCEFRHFDLRDISPNSYMDLMENA